MKNIVLILVLVAVQACAQKTYYGDLEPLGKFPSKLEEVSGIEVSPAGAIWVIQDSGNEDEIFQVDMKAKLVQSLKIDHAKNQDWEDLALDNEGNLYIGDFGNNANKRKDLTIYKVPRSELDKKKPNAKKIAFHYPEQKNFPPEKDSLYFDTEGFFHLDGHLYIFTKNRTRPYSGKTLIYRVPDTEGKYAAESLGSLFLCGDQDHCSVTGADISPDGKTIALLSYGLVFLLTDFELSDFSKASIKTIDLNCQTQIESICFLDDKTLLIADEQNRYGGRSLYQFKLD
ncbi:hypothetical protein SAMN04487891_101167 [Flagellimonas taeanensis]|uniref:SdiA-regulated n=1 Tax=Flagellimonas taeanensis TaxID=1005926 RepID=A0A1M6PG10_9FLAO|nr:hypothetical protein [Allomuricauda taeanensis]SFB66782.1 hypothetical protein SAMN04487891_101167 [Allomuricauda taeanensis]SHK06905.1 hypothetical protein SAMN05216293_0170 [Allomuricauda taeanensis]